MKKILITLSLLSVCFSSAFAEKQSCNITCLEESKPCYVTKDKTGCLIISNDKPSCVKGKISCAVPGSKEQRVYNFENGKHTTVITTTTGGKTKTTVKD